MFREILDRGLSSSGDGNYFFINKYVPKNVKKFPGSFLSRYFDLLIRYKKGDYKTIILFANILNNIVHNYFKFNDLILPIPSSNSYLDVYPNDIVCSYIHSQGSIRYEKNVIVCWKGDAPKHIKKEKRKAGAGNFFYIKKMELIKNADVLLFDDIITTGQTFNFIKSELLKAGAGSVTGLFISRTYNKTEEIEGFSD